MGSRVAELAPGLAKVVDLAVEDDGQIPARIPKRLIRSRRQVDDAKSSVSQPHFSRDRDSLAVGASMRKGAGHRLEGPAGGRRSAEVGASHEAAHRAYPTAAAISASSAGRGLEASES